MILILGMKLKMKKVVKTYLWDSDLTVALTSIMNVIYNRKKLQLL